MEENTGYSKHNRKRGKMIPKTDLDYVELFASKLRDDCSLFKQQKMLIESQLRASTELFREKLGTGKKFKAGARKYLKGIGLL